ncbi:MMPL family transporter [Luteimonas sp. S4-F44]|uniref:MMPL family transporter n=1 Tax=Luteimonas sp. S4-F44 TaxID=2925842 RepID=UPI001F52E7C7|nr:MMPL family transporter [Luteimonas sp. S4-F44]UNK42772.1 MMPL family transporter [Luteimonas sp. S4-F44]
MNRAPGLRERLLQRPRLRLGLAVAWLLALAALSWVAGQALEFSGDLRRFLPDARTPEQRLLIDELGDGPGSRLLMLAISGEAPEALAARSRALHDALAGDARFTLVTNGGEAGLEAFPEHLLPYRYLLTDSFDDAPLDAEALRDALDARLQDLGSPAAGLVEPLLPADPTLEVLALADAWQPAGAPQRLHEVWFDRAGTHALLLVETRAAGFDPTGQLDAVGTIRETFARQARGSMATLEVVGPGAFSVDIGSRTQSEAQRIGLVDTLGLIVLLLIAYRSWKMPLLGVLPLASAGIAGLTAVALLFPGGVHGITIAFGFTLIGVVQDYPIHFFSHQRAGLSPWRNVRGLWPALSTGVIATCIAYATFLFSGVDGLRQLAVFTITALVVAALATRYLLPGLVDPSPPDIAASLRLQRLWHWIETLPRPKWSLAVLALGSGLAIAFAPGEVWQNDLSKLTPVDAASMQRDAELRAELGAPDVRYVLVAQARERDAALAATAALRPDLDALVASGRLDSYDMAARYLPSAELQRARQAALPDTAALRAMLADALAGSAFNDDAFAPFVADIARAKTAPLLTREDLASSPLATAVSGLLLERDGRSTALVSLSGLDEPAEIAAIAAQAQARSPGVDLRLLDMKAASESLVVEYRGRVVAAMAVALVLLIATVWIALRSPRRVWRVLLPTLLTLLAVIAVLRLVGVELTLFHLVALILAAGLGLDYALFFEHAGDDRDDQIRTLHAIVVCTLMTLLVFSLLGLSSIPVLRAIGSTVALGVIFNFVLSLLVARHRGAIEAARSEQGPTA